MKKILLSLCLLSSLYIQAQNSCYAASTVCNNTTFSVGPTGGAGISNTLNISNPASNPASSNSGCMLSGAVNPTWMILTIANSGSFGFSVGDSAGLNPQTAFHDWIMWPYSATTCSLIFSNSLPPVRCNWNGASYGGTGMGNLPAGASSANFEPALTVNAGDKFILLMDNYSGITTNLTFSSTGTASLVCNGLINDDVSTCPNQQIIYTVNSGGLSNPSFTLNPGNTVQASPLFTLSSLVSKLFTVTVVGTNTLSLQQQSFTSTFAFNVEALASFIAVSHTSICEAESVAMSFSSTGNYTIFVNGPGTYTNYFSNPSNNVIVISPPGTGMYSTTTFNSIGCISNSTIYLDVQPFAKLTGLSANNICDQESVTIAFSPEGDFSTTISGPNAYTQTFPPPSSATITFVPPSTGNYSATLSYDNGCTTTSTVLLVLDACTDVNKNDSEKIKVWPNPVIDYLYFTDSQRVNFIELIDISGVTWKLFPEKNAINLSDFKEGIYTVRFYTTQNSEFKTRIILRK